MHSSHLEEIRLNVSDLEIGMHVVSLDRPWTETSFLLQGFIITSINQIHELQSQCEHVQVQVTVENTQNIAQNQNTKTKSASPIKRIKYLKKVSFADSIENSKMTFDSARSLAKSIMDGVRVGHSINMNHCRKVIDEIVDSVLSNPDALKFLSQIKNKHEYTAEHSMNVGILSATFARYLGLPQFEIKKIALSGLLHDVGKAKIPIEILNKVDKFTPEEARMMSNHAVFGRNLLSSLPQKDLATVDVAHSHHERIDGQGYPRKLESHQIPYYAKLVSIVDAYDAMTSNRSYNIAKSSTMALQIIKECSGTQFDASLSTEFIRCIGVYPVGSLVEMTSGEVGIVLGENETNPLKPKILLVRDMDKKPRFPEKVIRLDSTISGSYEISNELPNGSFGIDLREFIDKGLKLG